MLILAQIIASSSILKTRKLLAQPHDKATLFKLSKTGLVVPRVLLRAGVISLGQITRTVADILLAGVSVDQDRTFQTAATSLQAAAGITQDSGPEEAATTRETISLTHASMYPVMKM